MNFKNWLILSEEQLLNEDFKTQRDKFIQQGIEPDAVDYYLNTFKNIKDKIAELIIQKETELSSLHLVSESSIAALLYYSKDTEKIANLLGTDTINRLESRDIQNLIVKLEGRPLKLEIIAKILGETNISKLTYDSIKLMLSKSYPKKENIAKILNQYYTNKTPQIKRLINKHLKTKTPPE